MSDFDQGFLSERERQQLEEAEERRRKSLKDSDRRKQEADARTVTYLVRAAAAEVDVLAKEIDEKVRDVLIDFVTASSRQLPTIDKTEFCPNEEIDEKKPWQRYEKVHRWHAEYEAARIYVELHSMTTDRPVPMIGAFSGLQLRVMIKWGKSVPTVNLHRLDDVFEARLGIPTILDVEYESEDPARKGASRFRYAGR
jgi:hypothetical protein